MLNVEPVAGADSSVASTWIRPLSAVPPDTAVCANPVEYLPDSAGRLAEQMKAKGLKPVTIYTGARLHEAGKARQVRASSSVRQSPSAVAAQAIRGSVRCG